MIPEHNSKSLGVTVASTQFVHSNGLRMAYETFGDAQNPTLLLVAGLYNQLVRWPLSFCQELADRGFHVIRFDNRDIGLTDKMDGQAAPGLFKLFLMRRLGWRFKVPYQLEDMAADTIGLLDALGIQSAHIVGMSMGGMISQIAAARYPDRILSLTSIMSTSGVRGVGTASTKVILQMLKPRSKSQTALDIAVETWQMIGSPAYPQSDDEIRAVVVAEHKRSSNPAGYRRQMAAISAAPNRVALLKSIKVPVLIIHGTQDCLVPVSGGIDTAKHIRHARLELFDGMGHTLPEPLLSRFCDLIIENMAQAH